MHGLKPDKNVPIIKQWSVAFWTILPFTQFMTGNEHVLIQNTHGSGAFVQIDRTGRDLQVICELTGKVISADIDLRKIEKKGWHHIVVTCNNVHNRGQGAIKFFIDGE